MVSGSPDVSNSCVFPCSASCVSLSGWWRRALRTSPIHFLPPVEIRLPPLIATHLSLSLADCVRLFRCFSLFVFHPFVVGPTSLVFHSCLPVCLVVSGSPDVCLNLSPDSYVSQSGWWCPALWMFVVFCFKIHICLRLSGCLSPLVSVHLPPSLADGVRLFGCLSSCVFQLICLPVSDVCLHFFPNL